MTTRLDPELEPEQGIGWAIEQLTQGARVRRAGWNGKGMWLELQYPDENSKMTLPYVFMSTADKHLVPWLCSQTDLLAYDWELAPLETLSFADAPRKFDYPVGG